MEELLSQREAMALKVRSKIVERNTPMTKDAGTEVDPGTDSKSDYGIDKARSVQLSSN
jgi:hypothetical protein